MSKRVLILSNHFITLYNFRKELIKKLIEEDHEVFISMPKADENSYFINMGCRVIETSVNRRGINPIDDLGLVLKYIKIMRDLKPDIIFSYTIKPNIYGCIASNITKYKQISNITGTGGTFLKDNFISKVVKALYKISIKKSFKVFFQNTGDKNYFIESKMINSNYDMLPGSGVNLNEYSVTDLPTTDCISFIFIGRIMKIKGVDQYIEAAKIIKNRYPNTKFYIAGFIEEDSYKKTLNDLHEKKIIDYIGFQKDIKSWIKKCHCTVLPSHGGEGVPNVLLETAAMGRVCIASSINGSMDVVEDRLTGYLFEVGKTTSLVNAIEKYLSLNDRLKKEMGLAGRRKVEKQFDRNIVINKYLKEVNNA